MKVFLPIFIIILLPLIAFSQEYGSVSGTVLDASTNTPLESLVRIDTTGSHTYTDSNGYYKISNIKVGTHSITAINNDFIEDLDSNIIILSNKNTVVNFSLIRKYSMIDKNDTLSIKAENAYCNNDLDLAEIYLKMYISRNIPIQDSLSRFKRGYINRKNIACCYLKNIYYENEDFEDALYYHRLMNGIYKWNPGWVIDPPLDIPYTEYERDFFYAECFSGLHQYDSALKYINQYAFYIGSSDEKNTAEWIKYISYNLFGKEYVKKNLLNAVDNMYLLNGTFYTVFLGERHWININKYKLYRNYWDNITGWEVTKKQIQQEIRSGVLYKLIME